VSDEVKRELRGREISAYSEGIQEYTSTCPLCNANTLQIRETVYEVPHMGKVLIVSYRCGRCGYSHCDIFSLDKREPVRYEYRVDREDDLSVRVIRSRTARIRIPELGIIIDPGPQAEIFISNIEGVLTRIEELTKRMMLLSEDEEVKKRCTETLELVEKAKKGQLPFTLIIEDPLGISTIVPPPSKEHKLKVTKITLEEFFGVR